MRGPALEFSNVSLVLGGTPILANISFKVESGEIHCLIGPNGGGKTSLVRALLGEMPHTGNIAIGWQDATTIGYVPQSLDLDRTLPITVADFMAMIAQRRPAFLGPNRPTRATTEQALTRVALSGKLRRKLGDLSGGERQRLLLAQALTPKPALLILDEPSAGMDEAGEIILERILAESAAEGTTVLWIAHDLEQVSRVAHRVTCLNRTIRFHGLVEQVLTTEHIRAAYGMPVVRATAAQATI
jgi:zinc transport system ATP-binding protein